GARVLGGITIGEGAVIGANAVVIKDVPPRATAVGIPAKIIHVSGEKSQKFSP
ncbi:MAG: serine O-acetyltransferase, partial [Chloroflexota bacterium]